MRPPRTRGGTPDYEVNRQPETHVFTDSTRVERATYDPTTYTVVVTFPDGVTWQYLDVTPAEWTEFKTAASPGRYLNRYLNQHRNGPA